MTYNQLFDYLKCNYPNGALIKIFKDERWCDNLINGEYCLGTLEYYRNLENSDGRADKNDGVLQMGICGVAHCSDGGLYPMNLSSAVTGLAFCLFHYKNDDRSKENLKKSIQDLGRYLCILKWEDADSLYWKLACHQFYIKSLSGKHDSWAFDRLNGDNKDIVYCDEPDDSGFHKSLSFESQQEYRYIFSLEHLRDQVTNIDQISDQFVFYVYPNVKFEKIIVSD